MYENIMHTNITEILDKIFEKIIIKKDTILFSSFYTGVNLSDYLIGQKNYDEDYINQQFYIDHNNLGNIDSRLYRVFRMFDENERRKGGLYPHHVLIIHMT